MHTLFFEVQPRDGHEGHYFDRAAALKPELEKHEGMLFLDRYRSLARPDLILSYQYWRDEAALARWRTDADHHRAQSAGRGKHFADYRIRIGQVVCDAAKGEPVQIIDAVNAYNDPAVVPERFVLVVESEGAPFDGGGEAFSSLNRDEIFATLLTPSSRSEGEEILEQAMAESGTTRALLNLVSRDYSMFERAEAPQYYPPVKRS